MGALLWYISTTHQELYRFLDSRGENLSSERHKKIPCAAVTKRGKKCKAYAVHGEKYCSAHLGRSVGAGAPPGNQNARKHGFYGKLFTSDEQIDLIELSSDKSIEDELGMQRVLIRRLIDYIGDNNGKLLPEEYAQLVQVAFSGLRNIAALLRTEKALAGDAADSIAGHISGILDELSTELGIDL